MLKCFHSVKIESVFILMFVLDLNGIQIVLTLVTDDLKFKWNQNIYLLGVSSVWK